VRLILEAPSWSRDRFSGNWDVVWSYTKIHLRITVLALALGVALAFPLGIIGYRWRRAYPPILSITNVLYTVPSLALFVILAAPFGLLSDNNLIVALAIYTLAILVRNIVEGLRAVPDHVKDAALAQGYTPLRRLFAVELPLAVPTILAGLRVATVSTVSLVSVGGLLGRGGLGFLFVRGYQVTNWTEMIAALAASVVLAVVLDVVLMAAGRAATPWTRATGGRATMTGSLRAFAWARRSGR
jgi:osmoprotectant transport system permease protein